MRIVRKVLGWVASIALFAVVVVLTLAGEVAPQLLEGPLGSVPTWVWWTVVGGFVVILAWTLFNPRARRQWRQNREEARERKRNLAEFELD
jgi:hypothetical protein